MDGPETLGTPAIQVFLFKDSYEPFVALLQEAGIEFSKRPPLRTGVVMNSGLEIGIGAVIVGHVARVIVAYLKAQQSRKVIITTKANAVVHFQAEGLSQAELERVIPQVRNMTVIDTKPKKKKKQIES